MFSGDNMKKIGKLLIILLALTLFMLSLPLSASAEEESRFGRNILSSMSSASLMVPIYDELKAGCENLESDIPLSKNLSSESLKIVFEALMNDYPEFFWVTGGYTYTQKTDSDFIDTVSPKYLFPRSKVAAAKASLDAMASKLLVGLDGKSDYEKSLIIHDRLAEHITYKDTDNDQTAYGAIVEGEAVCAGYARAYQYLLIKVGIEAWSMSGKSYNPSTSVLEDHRWNMAKLDGKWCYTDVTWDDQGEMVYHNYFNRPLSYFKLRHFPETFTAYLPDDDCSDLDYFKKNNLVFTKVETKRLVNLLKKSDNRISIYVDGDVNAFVKSLGDKMKDIVTSLGAKSGTTLPDGSRYHE